MKCYSVLFEELMLSSNLEFEVYKRNEKFIWVKIIDKNKSRFNPKRKSIIKVLNDTKNKGAV